MADNADPLLRGRVRVTVPAVLGEEASGWAEPAAPFSGDGVGQFTLPPVGAGVWVEFEAGDPDYPIWTGGWWAAGQPPAAETGRSGLPGLKVIRGVSGLLVALDDDAQTLTLSDSDGANLVSVRVLQGQVLVRATARVVVDAPIIQLVEGATHPLVLGDGLLAYLNQLVTLFNSHLHPGETAVGVLPVTPAPPVPPFPPATPDLLSTHSSTG